MSVDPCLGVNGLSSYEEEDEKENQDIPTEKKLIKKYKADAELKFDRVIKNG
jgi:hypothetical protein